MRSVSVLPFSKFFFFLNVLLSYLAKAVLLLILARHRCNVVGAAKESSSFMLICRWQSSVLRVLSCCLSPRVFEHGDASGKLVLQ